MALLSPQLRQAIELHEFEGLPIREIASCPARPSAKEDRAAHEHAIRGKQDAAESAEYLAGNLSP